MIRILLTIIALVVWELMTSSYALAQTDLPDGAVIGEGRTPMGGGDAGAIRNAAKREAVRDAVLKAIKDATALDASDDKYAGLVNDIAKQVRNVKVQSEEAVGNEFVTTVDIIVDRKLIRTTIRGTDLDKSTDRSFGILLVGEEYLGKTTDLNAPVEDTIAYRHDKGGSFKDQSVKAASASASANSAVGYSGSVNANSASASQVNGSTEAEMAARYGDSAIGGHTRSSLSADSAQAASLNAKEDYAAAASSKAASASVSVKDVAAASHDLETYNRTVKYQDASKPIQSGDFFPGLAGTLGGGGYDLKVLNSADAKSQFFGDRKITAAILKDSAEMHKFIEFAHTQVRADFLMMGTSMVTMEPERSAATGSFGCMVTVSIDGYATAGAEQIIGVSQSASSNGTTVEECRANVSAKAARLVAPVVASQALTYWTNRAARGRQYTARLKGTSISYGMQAAFVKGLGQIAGATDVETRSRGADGVEATLTLKGKAEAMDAVYDAVSSQAAFASAKLDATATGDVLTVCIASCADTLPKKTKKSL